MLVARKFVEPNYVNELHYERLARRYHQGRAISLKTQAA